VALIVAAAPASAQPAPRPERPFPYDAGRRDALLLPAAAGVSLLGNLVAPVPNPLGRAELEGLSPDDVNAFDRVAARSWSESWATASDRGRDALLGAAVLLSFAPPAADGRWREAVTLGVMFTEAALLVEGTTYLAKDLAGRRRPWVHNTSLSVEERLALSAGDPLDARRSFFSGHASSAFALATLLSTVYADVHGRSSASDAVWAVSLSAAALTGVARVKAGMHYPSDVLAGAVVGAAIGRLVPALHRTGRPSPVRVHAGPGGVVMSVSFTGAR
jgi:membrane-associated phospholipid phosphatase